MKKLFLYTIFIFPFFCNAQNNHEVKLNILNTIVRASEEMGHEWVWNGQFVFGPYANIARNFSEEVNERFASVEANGGISIDF